MSLPLSGSQTVGPYFSIGLSPLCSEEVASGSQGEAIMVEGHLLDGEGVPVPDGFLEIWQADGSGQYISGKPASSVGEAVGFGRIKTGPDGGFRFKTIKPGAYPWGNHYNAWRPQHIHFSLFGAGILSRLVTQMYFPGDPLHALDPIFNSITDPRARERLIARFDIEKTEPAFALAYEFNIVLRGTNDTPFEEGKR